MRSSTQRVEIFKRPGRAASTHRLHGVVHQIDDQLLGLVGIGGNQGEFRLKLKHEFRSGRNQIKSPHLDQALNQVVETHQFPMRRLVRANERKVHHQFGGPVALVRHLLQISPGVRRQFMMGEDQFQIPFTTANGLFSSCATPEII